jgi:phosphoribosyl-dephospho-CoA transferase
MPRSAAIRLHADLTKLAVRVDLQLETPLGAVLLAEYVKTVDTTLLRTAVGPRLVRDPWRAGSTAGRV